MTASIALQSPGALSANPVSSLATQSLTEFINACESLGQTILARMQTILFPSVSASDSTPDCRPQKEDAAKTLSTLDCASRILKRMIGARLSLEKALQSQQPKILQQGTASPLAISTTVAKANQLPHYVAEACHSVAPTQVGEREQLAKRLTEMPVPAFTSEQTESVPVARETEKAEKSPYGRESGRSPKASSEITAKSGGDTRNGGRQSDPISANPPREDRSEFKPASGNKTVMAPVRNAQPQSQRSNVLSRLLQSITREELEEPVSFVEAYLKQHPVLADPSPRTKQPQVLHKKLRKNKNHQN